MQTILALTDFSVPSDNAVLYAAQLAQSLRSSLTILHVYQVPVSMSDVPLMMISTEELRENVEKSLSRTAELVKKSQQELEVRMESRLGDVVDEVNTLCVEIKPLLLVAGKHGAKGVERFLFGSTSLSLMRHVNYPLIAVPDNYASRQINNIAIALDPNEENIPRQVIRSFADQFNARLHIVYVQLENKARSGNMPSLKRDLNADSTVIHDSEFVHGIQTFISEHDIDLIMILPHRHSAIEKLFFRTHTEELMQKVSLPVLTIPGY